MILIPIYGIDGSALATFLAIIIYNTLKLVFGLFFSVLIYYINNFFNVLGNTEKLTVSSSIWIPLILLGIINIFFMRKINEK